MISFSLLVSSGLEFEPRSAWLEPVKRQEPGEEKSATAAQACLYTHKKSVLHVIINPSLIFATRKWRPPDGDVLTKGIRGYLVNRVVLITSLHFPPIAQFPLPGPDGATPEVFVPTGTLGELAPGWSTEMLCGVQTLIAPELASLLSSTSSVTSGK